MKRRTLPTRRGQSGVVLVVAMVLLLMLTLVSLAVARMTTVHTQVLSNEQVRTEAVSAANYALDLVLNEPSTTWTSLQGPTGRLQYVNLGIQGSQDEAANSVKVTVKNLTCKRARILKNAELVKQDAGTNYVDPADASCFGGGPDPSLIIVDPTGPSGQGNSNCGTVLYEVEAEASDPKLLEGTAKVKQGVEVRTDMATLESSCS